MSTLSSQTAIDEIPNRDDLMDYLHCLRRHGFVVASNRLVRSVGWDKKVEIEQYAYNKAYVFRARDGRIKFNSFKQVS